MKVLKYWVILLISLLAISAVSSLFPESVIINWQLLVPAMVGGAIVTALTD